MSTTTTNSRNGGLSFLGLFLVILLLIGGIWLYNRHHSATIGDHIGNAIDEAPAVIGKAADEVTDKDNYAKAGDSIEKAGDKAGHALSKAGAATSEAVSETSADLKAAADKQKAQDASSSRAN